LAESGGIKAPCNAQFCVIFPGGPDPAKNPRWVLKGFWRWGFTIIGIKYGSAYWGAGLHSGPQAKQQRVQQAISQQEAG